MELKPWEIHASTRPMVSQDTGEKQLLNSFSKSELGYWNPTLADLVLARTERAITNL